MAKYPDIQGMAFKSYTFDISLQYPVCDAMLIKLTFEMLCPIIDLVYSWTLIYSCLSDQVRAEISEVIGTRQVQSEDRENMPFSNAVIHETQRLGNVVPMNLPHRTSCNVAFQGHFIEKVQCYTK